MSRWEVCYGFFRSEQPTDGVVDAMRPGERSAEDCLQDNAAATQAADWHSALFGDVWGAFWPWWIAPFVLGALMLGVSWIRRGFGAPPN
jgi:hypothetical protein